MVLSQMRGGYKVLLYGGGGTAALTLGALLLYTHTSLVKVLLYQEMMLTEGSESFRIWRDTPVPQTMNFYLYNWTNPEDIRSPGVRPNLVEMGPYSFKVFEKKTNMTWNKNGTITFKIKRTWYYDPDNSKGSLDDEITTLNSVAMSAANTVRYKDLFLKKGLSTTFWATHQKISVTKKAGDLLFFGYTDPLLEVAKQLPAFDGIEIPPYDKFAWFYLRNNSDGFEGVFEMDRGVNDIFSFGSLKNWNYKDRTDFYPAPCGLVNGSAGELFPPEWEKSSVLQMFSADLCRSISLSYSQEDEVLGIKGYRYEGNEYTFDNGTLDPVNSCFCSSGEAETCPPAGVLNVTACRFGAPGFVSFPHFSHADDFYTRQVEGLRPDPQAHRMYITLEPNLGIPLDVAARFQINILISEVPDIALFEGVERTYLPVLWFEQKATITEELASQVRLALCLPLIAQCIGTGLIVIGLLALIGAICLRTHLTSSHNSDDIQDVKLNEGTVEPLIHSENNNPSIIQLKHKPLVTPT